MRRIQRVVLLAMLIGIAPVIAGCADFDPESLDFLGINQKKKLPGERRALFPEGVPGVSQGIPQEYMKGNVQEQTGAAIPTQPVTQAEAAPAGTENTQTKTATAEPAETKPKPKPRRHVVHAKPKPKAEAKSAEQAQPAAAQQQAAPWPAQSQPQQSASPWPSQTQQSPAPWPSAPPPGTFSKQ